MARTAYCKRCGKEVDAGEMCPFCGTRLGKNAAALDAMSPLKVLSRGYAIAETEEGKILRSCGETAPGRRIGLRLSDGRLNCRVLEESEE